MVERVNAMILAAGRGERMRPLTDELPKPLLSVGGKPLIVWHLERLAASGFREIVINHAWKGERIEAALGDGARFGARITYSAEDTALETAGGIARALPLLGPDAFIVVNGDIFTEFDFATLRPHATALNNSATLAHLVLVPNPPFHPQGDFALRAGMAEDAGSDRLTFCGVAVYRPELFLGLAPGKRAQLAPLLRAAMPARRVSAERFDGMWTDVGTPARLEELDRLLRSSGARDHAVRA
jgi:MurNAc alpha-1-phosphate uridylyltransferase